MPFILETGNNHKAQIFKEFHSGKEWKNDLGLFQIIQKGQPFSELAILNKNYELLAFYQVMNDGLESLQNSFSDLEFDFTYEIINPKRIEALPYFFYQNTNSTDTIIETEFKWSDQHFLLRNWFDSNELIQTNCFSIVDCILKLHQNQALSLISESVCHILKKNDGFHLLILRNNTLVFANSFEMGTAEEVIYFVISITKDMGINQENIEFLYDETQWEKTEISLWKSYFGKTNAYQDVLTYPKVKGELAFELRPFVFLFQPVICE